MTAPPPDMRGEGVLYGHLSEEDFDPDDPLLESILGRHTAIAIDPSPACTCSKGATCARCLGLTGGKR